MQVSPVHDRGITIRIDDEEEVQKKVQRVAEEEDEGEEEEEEDETEEEAEEETEEDTEEEDEGSDEETFGFRPQKKPAPVFVTQPKAPVTQPKRTFYWIAPFDD